MTGKNTNFDRKISFRLILKSIFHSVYFLITVSVSIYGLVISSNLTEEQLKDPYIENMKSYALCYGTNWNYVFQGIFLFLALSHDLLEWLDKQHIKIGTKIKYWRDVMYQGLVVPYTAFVFCMFWSLYAIDRELVFPKVYDQIIPWWFNQCVHTNIMVMVVVETFLQARRSPTNYKLELIMNCTVGVLYAIVYYSIFFITNRWLYNVFGVMTWWQVCLFQLLNWSFSIVVYKLQFPLYRLIHGPEPEVIITPKTPKKKDGDAENGTEGDKEDLSRTWELKNKMMKQFANSTL